MSFGFGNTSSRPPNPNKDKLVSDPPSDSISSIQWSPTANLLACGSWDNEVSRSLSLHISIFHSCKTPKNRFESIQLVLKATLNLLECINMIVLYSLYHGAAMVNVYSQEVVIKQFVCGNRIQSQLLSAKFCIVFQTSLFHLIYSLYHAMFYRLDFYKFPIHTKFHARRIAIIFCSASSTSECHVLNRYFFFCITDN